MTNTRILGPVTFRQLKALVEWEWSRELGKGWSFLWSVLIHVGLAFLLTSLEGVVPGDYLGLLLPAVVVVDFHRPFLYGAHQLTESNAIPRKFRSAPVPFALFAAVGLSSSLVKTIVCLSVFLGMVSLGGLSLSFLSMIPFWGLLLAVIPLSFGWGLAFGALGFATSSEDNTQAIGEFVLVLFGGVFLNPSSLPYGLGYLAYLTPYVYPLATTRPGIVMGALSGSSWLVSLLSILAGAIAVGIGGYLFLSQLGKSLAAGRFHRLS